MNTQTTGPAQPPERSRHPRGASPCQDRLAPSPADGRASLSPDPASPAAQVSRGSALPRRGFLRRRLCQLANSVILLRGVRVAVLALAALAGLALGVPAGAQADVLVSNLGQSSGLGLLFGPNVAQGFETGDNAAGYDLESIEVDFSLPPASATNRSRLTVTLWSATAETPDSSVATLTNPSNLSDLSGDRVKAFSAPTTGTVLSANTMYFVHLSYSGSGTTGIDRTGSANDDADPATGWSINDFYVSRPRGTSDAWSTAAGTKLKIRVNGTARTEPATNTAPTAADKTVMIAEAATYTFTAADFGFADANPGDRLESVRIVTATRAGTLALDGPGHPQYFLATRAEIDAGKLTFTPAAGGSGTSYASFTFTVNDGTDDSAGVYTMTMNVTPDALCAAPIFGDRRNFWTGTLTVRPLIKFEGTPVERIIGHGYTHGGTLLPDRRFSIGPIDFAILEIYAATDGDLKFNLSKPFGVAHRPALRLHVCDVGYDFSTASLPGSTEHQWAGSLDWSGYRTRTVYLSLPANNAATGAPVIRPPALDGTARVGETLNATEGNMADTDELPSSFTYTYQWYRVDADGTSNETLIPGATGATYTLTSDEGARKVKVKMSFTDELNGKEARTSAAFPLTSTVTRSTYAARNVTATVTAARSFRVMWDAAPTTPQQYRVESSKDGKTWSLTESCSTLVTVCRRYFTTTTAFTDDTGGGVTRHYRVFADHSGTTNDIYSETVSVTGWNAPSVQARRGDGEARKTTIELDWEAIDSLNDTAVTGYAIQVSNDGESWTDLVTDTGTTATRYTHTLARGSRRYYNVAAIAGSHKSRYGPNALATTLASPPVKPVATLTRRSKGSYILSWAPVDTTVRVIDEYHFRTAASRGVWSERPSIRSDGHLYIKVDGSEALVENVQVRAVIHERRLPGEGHEVIEGEWSDKASIATPGTSAAFNPFSGLMIGPKSHDGSQPFSLELHFNKVPEPLSERTVRDALLEVDAGTVTEAQRVTPGSDQQWRITVQPAGAGDVHVRLPARSPPCTDEATVCAGVERLAKTVSHVVRGSEAVLSASFAAVPATHDGSPFTVKLSLSEEPELSYKTVRDSLLTVSCATESCGTVTGASRVTKGSNLDWWVTVKPSQAYGITLTLPVRACGETGAVCVGGRALARPASATIPGTPLTATLSGPAEHDGSESFTVRLTFSMEPDVSYKTVRDTMFTEKGGAISGARRVKPPHDREFDIVVKPGGHAAVSFSLASPLPACGETGAVCTAGGRKIEGVVHATIPGPAALSVADARAEEATGATVDFTVTLSRAASRPVTVDYATSDGTATAGADYTATSGTLTFAAGATEQTVSVPVLDDVHDDGGETFTLTFFNPSGAWIANGQATGTIENSDPLQRAWLARFGRTTATHVTDAIGERLRATPGPASHLTVGGYRLPWGQTAAAAGEEAEPEADDPLAALVTGLATGLRLNLPGAGPEPDGGGVGGPATDPRLGQSQTLHLQLPRLRDVLLGSSFRLTLGRDDAGTRPRLTAWGRVAGTRFNGQDGALTLDGDVLTGTVGVDGEWDRWLAGVAVSHSRGEGSYTMPGLEDRGRGDLGNTLTSLHPYLRYAVTDRLDVWGVLGYGWGELTLEQETATNYDTDTTLVMGAVGGRGILLAAAETGGFQLATRTDAMFTRTTSEAVVGLSSADAEAHRLRVVLEGSRALTWAEGRSLTPSVEVGLRHDWGDAETGFGVELGGRVHYTDPSLGLTLDAAVRGLLAHEDHDYDEWGASGSLRLAPGAAGQGLSLTLAPTWGAASSGVDGLWTRQTTAGLAPPGRTRRAPAGRLNAEVGYGFPAFDTGLLTPYAGTVFTDGAARTYRLGTRWTAVSGLSLTLEGRRQESPGQQPVNQGLQLQIGWGF